MKTANLRKMFIKYGQTLDPPFVADTPLLGYAYIPIKRTVVLGQWQFIAMQFAADMNVFMIEVAISSQSELPAIGGWILPSDPTQLQNGSIRFRAEALWNDPPKNGLKWGINVDQWTPKNYLYQSYFLEGTMEGIFNSDAEAMEHLKYRIEGWILPYFDKMTVLYVNQNK